MSEVGGRSVGVSVSEVEESVAPSSGGYIEIVPSGTQDNDVEIPNRMCLNNNSTIISFAYDNLGNQFFNFE